MPRPRVFRRELDLSTTTSRLIREPAPIDSVLPTTPHPGDQLRNERERTAQRVEQLERSFADIVDAQADVATDDEHDPEGHTIAFERQQVSALIDEARAQLSELDAAIGRIASGDYGTCEECGSPIGDERLAALPEARRCIDCARLT